MTREEKELALYCLKASSDYHSEVCEECIEYPNCDHMRQDDVTETIIKAIEQEPCEDCISRQAVLEQTYLWSKGEFLRVAKPFDYLRKRINSLPSVTPKPKTDILDKIRAEIEQERVGYPPSAGYYKAIIKCLQIIDKYKAESEDAE